MEVKVKRKSKVVYLIFPNCISNFRKYRISARAIDLFLLRRGIVGKSNNAPQSLNLTVPLRNGTAAKIGIINAQTELDPLIAGQFGNIVSENSVATKAYSQIQKQGTEIKLDFGTPPESSILGQHIRFKNKIEIYMQNNGTAKEAVSTLVHETSHGRSIQLKRSFATKFDEFRAFTREELFRNSGKRPSLERRKIIWEEIQKIYEDSPLEKNPFTGVREK